MLIKMELCSCSNSLLIASTDLAGKPAPSCLAISALDLPAAFTGRLHLVAHLPFLADIIATDLFVMLTAVS